MAFIKSLFRSDDSQLMKIVDPDTGTQLKNDRGEGMGVMLDNMQSEACKKVISKFQRQHKKKDASYAEQQRFGLDLLQAATTDFVNLQVEEGGDSVDFSPEMARDIYANSDVIRKQVDEFIGADENFLASVLAA